MRRINSSSFYMAATILVTVAAFSQAPAFGQDATLLVKNSQVGIGISNPSASLHIQRSDGTTKLLVEEVSGVEAERTLYQLTNNGVTIFQLLDSSPDGSRWNFEAEGPSFRFNKAGSGGEEMILRSRLDGTNGLATLTVSGSISATNLTFTSSREKKTNFTALDTGDILATVAALPMSEWEFKEELNGRRHIGPVAEDFNEAFALGGTSDTISVVDASGVALASIQGLYNLMSERDEEIRELRSQNEVLLARLDALERRIQPAD